MVGQYMAGQLSSRAQHVWSRAVGARTPHLRIRHGTEGGNVLGAGHVMVWQDRDGYGRSMGLWLISDLLSSPHSWLR
jgi:hypothetical protein